MRRISRVSAIFFVRRVSAVASQASGTGALRTKNISARVKQTADQREIDYHYPIEVETKWPPV